MLHRGRQRAAHLGALVLEAIAGTRQRVLEQKHARVPQRGRALREELFLLLRLRLMQRNHRAGPAEHAEPAEHAMRKGLTTWTGQGRARDEGGAECGDAEHATSSSMLVFAVSACSAVSSSLDRNRRRRSRRSCACHAPQRMLSACARTHARQPSLRNPGRACPCAPRATHGFCKEAGGLAKLAQAQAHFLVVRGHGQGACALFALKLVQHLVPHRLRAQRLLRERQPLA